MEALQLDWSFLNDTSDQFTLNLSKSTLIECLDHYAENKKVIHPSVVGLMSQLKKHIRTLEFKLKLTIYPKHITSIFYAKFLEYLQDMGLKTSTIQNLCNGIRAVLSWASDYSAPVHPSYKIVDLPKFRINKLALTADDVSRIYHYDLSTAKIRPQHRDNLQRVKDMFVLGCNLGQRHSDLVRITAECFADGKFTILQQKTKNKAVVDIANLAIDKKTTYEILERYGYNAPYQADISNYNKHIRQLMKIIFKNETFKQQTTIGTMAKIIDVPKYTQIASHTARRTFATHNYLIKKIPCVDVMKATGHTSDRSFHKYICGQDD